MGDRCCTAVPPPSPPEHCLYYTCVGGCRCGCGCKRVTNVSISEKIFISVLLYVFSASKDGYDGDQAGRRELWCSVGVTASQVKVSRGWC